MKIAVFGATGGTGRAVTTQAVEAGHAVTALARDPASLTARSGLTVVRGDVMDKAVVETVVAGQDAVIVVLGIAKPVRGDTTLSRGTRYISDAMERHGVQRLVCQSAFGVGDSKRLAAPLFKYVILPFLRTLYEDKARQEAEVRQSDLDWTIVRPTHLVDRAASGRVQVIDRRSKLYDAVSRADTAAFLLELATSTQYNKRAIALGSV